MKCRLPMRILTAEKIDYADNFADNDWATIAKVCAAGIAPDSWKADGTSYKDMLIGGTNYRVDIIGKGVDEFSDGSGKAPFTFQLHEVYTTNYAMNSSSTNSGGWESSAMRKTHLPAILELMPSEVQKAIKEVNKLTSAGGQSSNIITTADKLFLLSEWELQGKTSYSYEGEGTQYQYYLDGGVAARRKNKPGDTDTTYAWRNRSPRKDNSTDFGYFSEYGYAYAGAASTAYSIAPAFCFGGKVGGSSGGGSNEKYALSITGSPSSDLGYITIDGTTYSTTQTVEVAAGTVVTVTCNSGNINAANNITLNGTVVVDGQGTGTLVSTYSFALSSNASIKFEQKNHYGASAVTPYCTATITTE